MPDTDKYGRPLRFGIVETPAVLPLGVSSSFSQNGQSHKFDSLLEASLEANLRNLVSPPTKSGYVWSAICWNTFEVYYHSKAFKNVV